MNSATTYITSTTDSVATQCLGEKIGRLLKGGTMIELVGDLGSGKTTLTQGIAKGMGFSGDVPSPTFTVSRVYPVRDGMQLHHFDWYRLHGPDMATHEFAEAFNDPTAVTVVEWAGNGKARPPQARLRISLEPTAHRETERSITIESLGAPTNYLIKGLAE